MRRSKFIKGNLTARSAKAKGLARTSKEQFRPEEAYSYGASVAEKLMEIGERCDEAILRYNEFGAW